MALALDGSAHVNSGSSGSLGVTLTTTQTNDIIIVAITSNGGPVTGISDGAGLTWALHARHGGSGLVHESWWAYAPSALSSDVITVTTTTPEFLTIDAFGISGADTSNVFDDNASVPDVGVDPGTISTDLADTIIIGAFRESSTANPTQGAGFTKIFGANYQLTEYKIVSTTQSSLSVTQGTGAGDGNGGVCTAVRMASGGGGPVIPVFMHQYRRRAA